MNIGHTIAMIWRKQGMFIGVQVIAAQCVTDYFSWVNIESGRLLPSRFDKSYSKTYD